MRTILKQREPSSLTKHRTAGGDYKSYQDKETLRNQLVREQRGICCYCMSRIHADPLKVKIEHWHSQARYPNEQLDYVNLLASCTGGQDRYRAEGRLRTTQAAERRQTLADFCCDAHKGDKDISIHPVRSNPAVELHLHYTADGRVHSDIEAWNHDLDVVLNLNLDYLRNQRKAVLDGLKGMLHKKGTLRRAQWEAHRRIWDGSDGLELRPYCQVIVYWIDKHLARWLR